MTIQPKSKSDRMPMTVCKPLDGVRERAIISCIFKHALNKQDRDVPETENPLDLGFNLMCRGSFLFHKLGL